MSGNIWKYSGELDDWDIEFAQKDFITYREGCDYYHVTERVLERLARNAGAIYKMGNRFIRIKRSTLEAYLRQEFRKGKHERQN